MRIKTVEVKNDGRLYHCQPFFDIPRRDDSQDVLEILAIRLDTVDERQETTRQIVNFSNSIPTK